MSLSSKGLKDLWMRHCFSNSLESANTFCDRDNVAFSLLLDVQHCMRKREILYADPRGVFMSLSISYVRAFWENN